MEKIQIVGSNATFDLAEVQDNVIKLSGRFFWRDDTERVVKVNGRFYRKESPLLVKTKTPGMEYALKKDSTQTEDGLWLVKEHPDTVLIDGKFTRKRFCIEINGEYYLKTDPSLVKDSDGYYRLKSECELLSTKYYNTLYVHRQLVTQGRVINTVDGLVFKDESLAIINAAGTKEDFHYSVLENNRNHYVDVFSQFRDAGNPDPNRVQYAKAHRDVVNANFTTIDDYGFKVHNSIVDEIKTACDLYVERNLRDKIEHVRATMNKTYAESGPDENQAKVISFNYHRFPGNQRLFTPEKSALEISKRFNLTGGKKYTFGVELETSAGMVSDSICGKLGLTKVGDGSIGSAEYVTPPLHGNTGVERLKAAADHLAKSTFVDDRCAIHIHVGGADNSNVDTPDFNRRFMINAISLGAQIEEDMYKISPKTRAPEYKHCHSILRYKDINLDNWKDYLGAYVFGPQENWDNNLVMSDYQYGTDGRTSNTVLGPYNGGRYKWLNLVNIASRANIKTLEFRMFAGSTNFDKIHNYVLICLAFVWFVENRSGDILKGGNTLESVIATAYADDHEICRQVFAFIEARKAKFNRTKVYSRKPS